ncbi:hypothetical protein HPB49_002713 [Dermacentor silvarum]|uniref:Uncharacterized protein n=1 Tax=Dermacentor silvarum TaxID=543639 RepID=A0ACB8DAF6_DERSI|nr:hypothetical protein HPB49_002713 [Dermacentor silvarum]
MCEKHFESRFIERSFKSVVRGELMKIPRETPQLTKDAVPTVFHDALKYLTKPVLGRGRSATCVLERRQRLRNESDRLVLKRQVCPQHTTTTLQVMLLSPRCSIAVDESGPRQL